MFTMLALGFSLLQAKAITVACWVETPSPTTMTIKCGLAVDDKVINAVSSPVIEIYADVTADDLAQAFCQGTYAVMGAAPPVEHKI